MIPNCAALKSGTTVILLPKLPSQHNEKYHVCNDDDGHGHECNAKKPVLPTVPFH